MIAWYDCRISTGKKDGINNKNKVMRHDVYGFRNERFFNLRLYAQHDCRITRNVWWIKKSSIFSKQRKITLKCQAKPDYSIQQGIPRDMRFHSDDLLIAGKQWYYTWRDLVQYSQVCKGEPYRQESIFLSTIYLHDKNSPYKSPQSGTSIRMQSPKSKGIVTLCLSLTNAHRFAILTLKTANTILHKANQSLFFLK